MPATYTAPLTPTAAPPRRRARYNVARPSAAPALGAPPPTGDERLTGADAELASRQQATYAPPAQVASGANVGDPGAAMIGVGDPNAAPPPPPSQLEEAQKRLNDLVNSPVEDANGRGKSGLRLMAEGASEGARTGSLAFAAGRGLAGLAKGLIRPKTDEEEIDRPEQERRARYDVQLADQAEKTRRENDREDADAELKREQAGYYRDRNKTDAAKEQNREEDSQRRVVAQVFNGAKEFDPSDPANADTVAQLKKLGLPVLKKTAGQQLKMVQDAGTGAWSVIAGDKATGEATARAVYNAPGADGSAPTQLTTKPTAQVTKETADANRASRESLAKMADATRRQIAAQQASIARDRVKLSKAQFSTRYPLAGTTVSQDYVIKKFNEFSAKDPSVKISDVVNSLIRQGAKIQD
ncbi:MAG: hypothetical protein ACJ741_06590 [Pyrinomonadaceae bacterium]